MRIGTALGAALAAAVAATTLVAETSPADAIKARQQAMEGIGGSMKGLGAIAKKQAPFDAAVVKKSAAEIAKGLETARGLFGPGTDKGDVKTYAKPEAFSEAAAFSASLQASHAAAVALQAVTTEAAFGPALQQLGGTCKSCHEKYRLPKH